ncbi:hypothetical protein EDD21DRAFT_379328 [Dissophora ornata]|nr:hypothetical protein BGZ58_010541 [Dissophora ornata]KAI8599613.1 hypothetical protein EDD21DRAFT_379328 [Dissophora ornata]
MGRSTSTSSSNRFSLNGHTNNINTTNAGSNNNSNGSILPLHHFHNEREHSPDLEAYGNKTRKSRTPSPPLSPDRPFPLKFRLTKKPCLLLGAMTVGLLFPVWIFTSGVITLDSFNDTIRYLPGYHYFANNLLYLVMFLLLVSFTVLATMPILPIFILGLPFHLLIFSIFNKLMGDWVLWCVSCYTILFLAPVGSTALARIKAAVQQHDTRRELPIRHKSLSHLTPPSPSSFVKYSPLNNDLNGTLESGSFLDNFTITASDTLAAVGSRLEHCVHIFSTSNRTSTRWRLALALIFWLSYVVPVTIGNESRDFDPNRSSVSFDIKHPEPLCSAREMEGYQARHETFDGYWQEYLQFHHRMVLPEEEGGVPQERKRFLVFQPSDDGLGNRLQALLSSVVMAMVTRRAIVLDWLAMPQCNANFTDLFQQPEGLVWDLNTTIPHYKDLPEYKTKPEIWYPYCRNCALRSPITPDSTWSKLLCDADLGINNTIPIAQIFSTQWFLPVIQNNPQWRRELCHMFPEGGQNAFQLLAKKLLKPSTTVQEKIDSVMDRIPEGVTLIGLQVRRTENNAVGQGIEDSFLSCAAEAVEEEEAKVATGFMTGSGSGEPIRNRRGLHADVDGQEIGSSIVQRGHSAVRGDGEVSFPGRPKFAYYLATDYRPTRAHFQKVLGDKLYVLDNTFQSNKTPSSLSLSPQLNSSGKDTSDRNDRLAVAAAADNSSEGNIPNPRYDSNDSSPVPSSNPQTEAVVRNSVQGVQTAVAEMFLLAQADRIVSSPYSTFGYFAHGYANVQPNIVKRDGTCIKRKSTQPCFQYWFGFANGGAKCNIKSTIEMSEDYDCWL